MVTVDSSLLLCHPVCVAFPTMASEKYLSSSPGEPTTSSSAEADAQSSVSCRLLARCRLKARLIPAGHLLELCLKLPPPITARLKGKSRLTGHFAWTMCPPESGDLS